MQYGLSCLTMTFFMHTSMVSFSSLQMGSLDVSSLAFSHTLLITQKSKLSNLKALLLTLTSSCRVLLATIQYLGRCPCPRCLVQKAQIAALGTTADRQRRAKAREDNSFLQDAISRARKWIYEKGYSLTSSAMKNGSLGLMSAIPTRVRSTVK